MNEPRLHAFPSFASWSEQELLALETSMKRVAAPAGHVFVHEGQGASDEDALFALVKGRAAVHRSGAKFVLDEGSLFGVVAFVDHGARSATVSAEGDAEVMVLSRDAHARLAPALAARLELVIARQLADDFAAMNRRAVDAFTGDALSKPANGPTWENVASYSGLHQVRTEIHRGGSVRELVATLATARKQGRRVVVRGAGLSFDNQSMYGDLSIVLSGFDEVTIDKEANLVTVGAGAKWGDVLPKLEAAGMMLPIVVSGMGITCGGTLGVNALSRFSPVWGKEGKSVESLEVLTVSGERVVCSRTKEPELFHGVIGGLGQLAVVLKATYRAMPLGTPIRVESRVTRTADQSGLAAALALPLNPDHRAQTSYAVVAFKGDEVRSIVTRSRYVNDVPLKTLLPHRPANFTRLPIELAIHHFQSMGQAFWNFAYERYLDDDVAYIDELNGYTFFMDGNARTKRTAEAMGISFRTMQETYLLPKHEQLLPFIIESRDMVRAAGLELALVDVIHLHQDEGFAMSSTRGGGGFAVTLTFEGLDSVTQTGRARELFVDLATRSMALGGLVHLTKNVFARPGDLSRMYRDGLTQMIAAKRKYDPFGLLTSDFAQRLFPSLAP